VGVFYDGFDTMMKLPSFPPARDMLAADLQRLNDVAAEGDLDADVLGIAAVCPFPKRHGDGADNQHRPALLCV